VSNGEFEAAYQANVCLCIVEKWQWQESDGGFKIYKSFAVVVKGYGWWSLTGCQIVSSHKLGSRFPIRSTLVSHYLFCKQAYSPNKSANLNFSFQIKKYACAAAICNSLSLGDAAVQIGP
jgi:hypothetical protein